jgi:hypothetical protein
VLLDEVGVAGREAHHLVGDVAVEHVAPPVLAPASWLPRRCQALARVAPSRSATSPSCTPSRGRRLRPGRGGHRARLQGWPGRAACRRRPRGPGHGLPRGARRQRPWRHGCRARCSGRGSGPCAAPSRSTCAGSRTPVASSSGPAGAHGSTCPRQRPPQRAGPIGSGPCAPSMPSTEP